MNTKPQPLDHDLVSQLRENEFRIMVLENVVEVLLQKFPSIGGPPISKQEMDRIRHSVVAKLQRKHPDTEISLGESQNDESNQ